MAERTTSAGYRQKRRALEKMRRRRRRRRLMAAGVALVVVVAGVWLGVGALRGEEPPTEPGTSTTSSTLADVAPSAATAVLVRVDQEGSTQVAVLVASEADPPFVLGLPGDTLVESATGFEPLSDLLDGAGLDAVASALASLTGVEPQAIARVAWQDLRTAGGAVTSDGLPDTLPEDKGQAALACATAVAALAAAGADDPTAGLALDGDAAAVSAVLRSLGARAGVVQALPGREVEGTGFTYYEPDPAATQLLLGGAPPEQAVSVEVQNGSGAVGIAQKVSDVIQPLGYTMLPPKNADAFPNVETTQIFAAPDVLAEADRIRERLGKGTVVQQEDLPAQRIVVVVGKDLTLDDLQG